MERLHCKTTWEISYDTFVNCKCKPFASRLLLGIGMETYRGQFHCITLLVHYGNATCHLGRCTCWFWHNWLWYTYLGHGKKQVVFSSLHTRFMLCIDLLFVVVSGCQQRNYTELSTSICVLRLTCTPAFPCSKPTGGRISAPTIQSICGSVEQLWLPVVDGLILLGDRDIVQIHEGLIRLLTGSLVILNCCDPAAVLLWLQLTLQRGVFSQDQN